MSNRVTRLDLIRALADIGTQREFSTRDLCQTLRARDHQIRGAMAWCIKARIVVKVGEETRRDCAGRPYPAARYVWTGRTRVRREIGEMMDAANRWLRGVLV